MIYLIQSAAYVDNSSDKTENILKIGYCNDTGKKARMKSYLTENPTMRTLYLIPGGTEQDERNLHYHFRDLKKSYGREWFTYSPEILEFFQSHTTKESLEELDPNLEDRKRNRLLKTYGDQVRWWINSIMCFEYPDEGSRRIEITESLIDILLYHRGNMEDYVKITYPGSWERIYEKYQKLSHPLPPKVQEYLDYFNSLSTFPDKMRYFQDVTILLGSSPELVVFLDQIPRRIRDYYEVFGFERMRALNFLEKEIKKEWDRIMGNYQIKDELQERIYQGFQVGQSYSKSFIKEKLKEIYQEVGHQETPKATNIQEYFEIKDTKIPLGDGTRAMGFKLIKKRE